MKLTQHIKNYKNVLNKTQQKQFDKILDVFNPLRPHTIHKVTTWIKNNKTKSENTRANYYRFRDFLYESCFDVLGYQKTIDNFTIGDTVFLDDCKNQKTISEFIITPKETFVIFDDYRPPIDSPTLIQQIRKNKRPTDQPLFEKKEKAYVENLTINHVTSCLSSFLHEYTDGSYDFDPIYQRNLIWTKEQKQAFLESLVTGQAKIEPTFIKHPFKTGQPDYEVLDGKQRLNAIIDYVHGEFPIYGLYYDQLSDNNIQILYDVPMVFKHIVYYGPNGQAEMPLDIKLELFLQENDYGTHVSKEHLANIKETLQKQTKD